MSCDKPDYHKLFGVDIEIKLESHLRLTLTDGILICRVCSGASTRTFGTNADLQPARLCSRPDVHLMESGKRLAYFPRFQCYPSIVRNFDYGLLTQTL